jgi:hypothetical protein|tara:strand:+ start:61 stop:297 length:237 start_codon:yes stop_codon:yes gene_type:complete
MVINPEIKQKYYKKKVHLLAKELNRIEEELHNHIQELSDFGEDCDCGKRDSFNFIYYGDWMEIQAYCLNCGGFTNVRD